MSEVVEKRQGHCPRCGAGVFADVVGCYIDKRYTYDQGNKTTHTFSYRIMQCCGCREVYFAKSYFCDYSDTYEEINEYNGQYEAYYVEEDIKYFPAPIRRKKPDWVSNIDNIEHIDEGLLELLNEVYGAINADLRVAAAISIRTAFDRASELLGINPSLKFFEKLDKLQQSGRIGLFERESLNALINAGSAAAHRGWRPDAKLISAMMDILEAFLHRAFIAPKSVDHLKDSTPPKPPRGAKKKPPVEPSYADEEIPF